MKRRALTTKPCPKCKKTFKPTRLAQVFCTWDCAWNNQTIKFCEQCGKKIMVYPCLLARKRFCSRQCRATGSMTLQVRDRIRKTLEIPTDARKRPYSAREFARWSKAVKQAGKYVCINCRATSKLVAHHILSFRDFPLLRYDVKNGVVLCRSCHPKVHFKKSHYQKMQKKRYV